MFLKSCIFVCFGILFGEYIIYFIFCKITSPCIWLNMSTLIPKSNHDFYTKKTGNSPNYKFLVLRILLTFLRLWSIWLFLKHTKYQSQLQTNWIRISEMEMRSKHLYSLLHDLIYHKIRSHYSALCLYVK